MLDIAVEKAIVHLGCFVSGEASLFRPCLNRGHLPRCEVRYSRIVHESLFDQILHCLDRFIEADMGVPGMELVEVNPIGVEAFETLPDGLAYMMP